ncbi:MAG: hypothetical protein V3T18_02120 [Pseudomonadales bacterium]
MIYAAIAGRKTTGEVCLDGEKSANQPSEIAIAGRMDGTQSTQPARIGFCIAVEAKNGYSDGRNRLSSGGCRVKIG